MGVGVGMGVGMGNFPGVSVSSLRAAAVSEPFNAPPLFPRRGCLPTFQFSRKGTPRTSGMAKKQTPIPCQNELLL
jgi:hypothetical protein